MRSTRLLAVLGTAFGLSVAVGNTIGSGILRTPGDIARLLGDARLFILIWLAGALYSLLGANAYCELATMIPESGGHTVYVRRALGPFPGFVVAWSDWLSTCGTVAAAALVIGESGGKFVPLSPVMLSTLVVVALALIQMKGVRIAGRMQEVTALAKSLIFIGLVIACFVAAPAGVGYRAATAVAVPASSMAVAIVLSMQAVIFTYDGYYGAIYFAGEVKNPGRDIPRSVFGGVALISVIYLLINVGFVRVLGIGGMAGDPLVAATAARRALGTGGDTAIRILTIVSLVSAVNAFQLMASRTLYRLGARGVVRSADLVNSGGTPAVSLGLSTATALIMIWTGTFEEVLALVAFIFVAQYLLDFLSLVVLRAREPEAARPFRAWGHPATTWGLVAISVCLLAGAAISDPKNSAYSLGLLVLSYPMYLLVGRTLTSAV